MLQNATAEISLLASPSDVVKALRCSRFPRTGLDLRAFPVPSFKKAGRKKNLGSDLPPST